MLQKCPPCSSMWAQPKPSPTCEQLHLRECLQWFCVCDSAAHYCFSARKWVLKATDELEYMQIASQKDHCTLLHPYKCHRAVVRSEWQSCKMLFHMDCSPAHNFTRVVVVWRGPSLDGCCRLWLSGISLSLLWVLVMLELRHYCSKMQSSPCTNHGFRSSCHTSLQLSLVLCWRSSNIFFQPY